MEYKHVVEEVDFDAWAEECEWPLKEYLFWDYLHVTPPADEALAEMVGKALRGVEGRRGRWVGGSGSEGGSGSGEGVGRWVYDLEDGEAGVEGEKKELRTRDTDKKEERKIMVDGMWIDPYDGRP